MSKYRYIIPAKVGLQHFSGEPVPEMEPAEFVAEEVEAMEKIRAEARSKGLALGDEWLPADDGWEQLEVWQCQEDKEEPGRPHPPIGRVLRRAVKN